MCACIVGDGIWIVGDGIGAGIVGGGFLAVGDCICIVGDGICALVGCSIVGICACCYRQDLCDGCVFFWVCVTMLFRLAKVDATHVGGVINSLSHMPAAFYDRRITWQAC